MTMPTDTQGAPEKPFRWEDFVDVFVSPSRVFARRADGKFGLALVVLFVLVLGLAYATASALQPVIDADIQRQMAATMEKNPQVNADQVRQGMEFFQRFAGIFLGIVTLVSVFVVGVVVLGVGKIFGGKHTFAQAMVIATFAYFPRLLDFVSKALQALLLPESALTGNLSVSLSAGRFLDPDAASPIMLALLGRVDLFVLWGTALVAIGLGVLAKLPKGQAYVAAATIWLLGSLPTLFQAMRAG